MKVKRRWYDVIIDILCLALLVGVFLYLRINWDRFPAQVPAHYGIYGEIDRWGDKTELLTMPIMASLLYIFLRVIEQFPAMWNTGVDVTEENKEIVYRILKNLLQAIKLLIVTVFILIAVLASLAIPLPIWFLVAYMALILGTILFFCMQLRRHR